MFAREFIDFVNASPSPFHAVEECTRRLLAHGFERISEVDVEAGTTKLGGKYFFTRNRSTLFAFAIGAKYEAGAGVNIIGAHTDSPVLKVKPRSAVSNSGFLQLGVEPYGGGLWHTWFDRDLSLAGRVIISDDSHNLQHRLIHIKRPILRIPTLAIHLDRSVKEGFKFNDQTHLLPILCSSVKGQLEGKTQESNTSSQQEKKDTSPKHHPVLLNLLKEELSADSPNNKEFTITDFELSLYDTQLSVIGGLFNEYIFSPRLDNLMSSFCALTALIQSSSPESLASESRVRLIALFDHEEVGSASQQGAASTMLEHFIKRISKSSDPLKNTFESAIRKCFLISADMAHACHPNYSDKHEPQHRPEINKGPVIKFNANQRYATNSVTSALLRQVAQRSNVPLQEFVIRNDALCGSTIGPILSTYGVRTIDIGSPQLSMHSIREVSGVEDVDHATNLFKAFFQEFTKIDQSFILE